jgi:hypothetical protein
MVGSVSAGAFPGVEVVEMDEILDAWRLLGYLARRKVLGYGGGAASLSGVVAISSSEF